MLYPAVNEKDLGEIPEDARQGLELIPVENMDQVFEVALHRVIPAAAHRRQLRDRGLMTTRTSPVDGAGT